VLTVRGDLTNKVLRASRAYGPDDQHHSSRNVVEAKDFQRFARVHGQHREQPPEVPLATLGFVTETAPAPPSLSENVLGYSEENLALFEEQHLSQSEKKRFADEEPWTAEERRLGAQRESVLIPSSDLRFMQTNNQEPERETRRDSRSPEPLPRRGSVDGDEIRRKVRDMREAAAENRVPHCGPYPSSNQATGQGDTWSSRSYSI
jgi:hypothetical protein